jgi:hypothetical protein
MTANTGFDEFRDRMNDYRGRLVRNATLAKEMNLVVIELEKQYSRLQADDRIFANRVICEWLQSEDSGARWDARVLIKKFKIRSAMHRLKELETRLKGKSSASAPDRFELAEVQKIIEMLMGQTGA